MIDDETIRYAHELAARVWPDEHTIWIAPVASGDMFFVGATNGKTGSLYDGPSQRSAGDAYAAFVGKLEDMASAREPDHAAE